MWITYSKKGTKIESYFWDWACMEKIITDYKEDLGLTDAEAYHRFWEDVQKYDPEGFAERLGEKTVADMIADEKLFDCLMCYGWLDEVRADYLRTLNIECERTEDTP